MCPDQLQNVHHIIFDHLTQYPLDFPVWSGLVRRSAMKYSWLPDPLQYLQHPWRPDRWRTHCSGIISQHWDEKLREDASSRSTLELLDVSGLSISKPHRIYSKAGLVPSEVTKATVVSWMLLGTYYTREILHFY